MEVRKRIGNDEKRGDEGEKEGERRERKVEATFETQRAAKMKSSAFLPFEKFVIRLQNFSWILARKKILEAATGGNKKAYINAQRYLHDVPNNNQKLSTSKRCYHQKETDRLFIKFPRMRR